MSAEDKQTILIRDIPGDVIVELDRRAKNNFRSRVGEVQAILAAVCRGGATLPGLGVGELVPMADGTGITSANAVAMNGDAHDGESDREGGDE